MKKSTSLNRLEMRGIIEPLEARIAPAVVVPVVPPPLLFGATVHSVAVGSAILLHAGDVLSTSDTGGAYLMYVKAGQALVFTTDLNQNGLLDTNEITGIAAGNGLQLVSFTDIHGDVVTNLNLNGTLTDSDNNGATGPASSNGRDGQILLPSKITSIEMRSLTVADMTDQNADGVVDGTDVQLRLSPSAYSIFGNIYAGSGFGDQTFVGVLPTGAQNPAAHGLLFDSTGFSLQATSGKDFFTASTPEVGSILVGTAASNSHFSFGPAFHETNPQGLIQPFFPGSGVAGGGIFNIRSASTAMKFSIDTLHAGNGGFGAAGGSIDTVIISGDDVTGYSIIAGDGGAGFSGGAGGSITNFNDAGSLTAHVTIKAGDGGRGLTGPGGNGGQIALLGTVNFVGNVDLLLGNGANGFTAGGAGASLVSATIVSVDPSVSTAIDLITTTRDVDPAGLINTAVPTIGQTEQVDFNGDGVNDMVFSTSNPSQIVVVFGLGAVPGTFDVAHPLYLNGPDSAHIAVGDFNADGAPDIVAISGVANDGGISVYLNDGHGNFPSRQQSALPSLFDYGYYGGPTLGGTGIAVGDFNGDGILDVAEKSTVMNLNLVPHHVVEFLYGVADGTGKGSGYFAGDFKRADVAAITLQPTVTPPFVDLGPTGDGATIIKATALNDTALNDVLVGGFVGRGAFDVIDDSAAAVALNGGLPQENFFGLGQVDTNRDLPVGTTTNLALVDATLNDFTVVDLDNDGNADIATLTQAPVGFIVTHVGDGTGNFAPGSGGGNNAGIYLGPPGVNAPNSGFGFDNIAPAAIRTTDSDGDGVSSELAVLDYNTVSGVNVYEINLNGGFDQPAATFNTVPFATPLAYNNAVIAFDTYTVAGTTNVGYGVAEPSSGNPLDAYIDFEGDFPIGAFVPLDQYGLHITMGTGGNGAVGPGGVGGTLGGPLINTLALDPVTHLPIVTTSGTIHITLPANGNFQGIVDLFGADGGNGFTAGGTGGNVQGVTVDGGAFDSTINIVGGRGGFGLTGAGGAGGALAGNSIINGVNFTAGDGGQGMIGGSGGSIVGNNSPTTFDSETVSAVRLHAGQGAHGILLGGAGGSVNNFDSYFLSGGLLDYEAGNGGTAVSGAGGGGGSILTSSVNPTANHLSGEIYLLAGNGGNGLTGGGGGSLTTFINSPVAGVTPTTLSALAGNGGDGITGPGGIGGSISSLNVAVSGIQGTISLYPYTRILAGNGGHSFGGTGAVGGSLSGVVSTSQNSALVAVAGRGGDGLVAGGAGGGVTSATLNAAAITGNKVLVIAGRGGDGYGALATTTNIAAQDGGPVSTFGNVAAHGGNGGGISGFTQPITIQTRVDLNAGDGGGTVNYGTSNDSLFNVGVGGSITGVNITGTIGNVNHAVPIKAYNDVNNDGVVDEGMAVFVQNFFVNNATPLTPLDDTLGNVGLVAGAPGRVKGDNPASIAASGSISGITARSIMSMVAGSVDRIAAIQSVSGISHSDPNGVFGSDKDDPGNANVQGTIDYYNLNGTENHTGPVIGGRLLDGAVVAKAITGITGTRVFKR